MASFLLKLYHHLNLRNNAKFAFSINPIAAACSGYEDKYNLKIRGYNRFGVGYVVDSALCPHLSATNNLTRLLNLFDQTIEDYRIKTPCPRWNVMQDPQAIHLVRNMSGLPKKNVEEFHPYTKQSRKEEAVFGCVRVVYTSSRIEVIVGQKGPHPGASYLGYSFTIELDERYKIWDTEMDVKNEVLKITIPKEKGEWIHTITTDLVSYDSF